MILAAPTRPAMFADESASRVDALLISSNQRAKDARASKRK